MAVSPELSLVLPAHNEALNLPEMLLRIHAVLGPLACSYEIIVVDDGSTDATWAVLQQQRTTMPNLRLIRLSRNFGKEAALNCGLAGATGAAVVTMDCDMQHPPETLPAMRAAWLQGGEIVMTLRQGREFDHPLRRALTKVYYFFMSRLSEIDIPVGLGDFNLYDRKVVTAILQLPERNRYMKGVVSWVGYKRVTVPVSIAPRAHGQSQFPLLRLIGFAILGITAFSNMPLKIWSALGAVFSLVALGYGGFLIFDTIAHGVDVPGYASLMVAVLFLGGIQLISLGVIGEYLGRVFNEVKARPLYLIAAREGFYDET
ncbi:MAG: glycosyltransferase family 2 protein [Alphaproteobacteria bacterium]|nr:glycosyltransferase family 2 protein [Alphaproteobacteria bacterium]